MAASYETIRYEKQDHRALIVLDRPEVHNAFNLKMQDELKLAWEVVRRDEDVRVVILTGAGERAFCTGIDLTDWERPDGEDAGPTDLWHKEENGSRLTARQNEVWKPVITAVNGMCAGAGFFFIVDSDIVMCSENATFFDPHVSYGLVASLEPIALAQRIPFGEAMRIALAGTDERVGAQRAYQIGLVSEVTPQDELLPAAERLAATIASHPPIAVQGTVKAVWRGLDVNRRPALEIGALYPKVGNTPDTLEGLEGRLTRKERPKWRLR